MKTVSTTLKVWVVDDEPGMCLGAKRALEEFHIFLDSLDEQVAFTIETLDSGEALFERLQSDRPHILLLDCKLPGIDGIEVLARMLEEKTNILTIMITAYATLDMAVQATKLGAYDFLAKPFTPDELRSAITKASRDVILTEKAKKLAEEKRQIRFEFVSVLAHELKSPLNAIEGYIDMMCTRTGGDTLEDYDHVLSRVGIRLGGMRKLIADLLDLTSIESGKKERLIEDVNLKEVVETILENNRLEANNRSITLETDLPDTASLQADKGEMEMLFNNFVSNGIKYNVEKGLLRIAIKPIENGYTLSFTDTGIGLSEEEQKRLFKEFSRVKNRKTRSITGSGLGLSIIAKIVALYRGAVSVKSQPDEGSVFTVTLYNAPLEQEIGNEE